MLVIRVIKIKQLPFLASALAMVAGLYLLAGPFRSERSGLAHLLPLWGVVLLYEFTVIGMIAFLRRAGIETRALTLIALFFLADPAFFGDAFASTHPVRGAWLCGAGWILSLVRAWALSRALSFRITSWPAGWVAAALGLIHLFPPLNAAGVAQPALQPGLAIAALWIAAAVAAPLWRSGAPGRAALGAVAAHAVASMVVASVEFRLDFLCPPLVAASAVLPWPAWGWIPLPAALFCSPARTWASKTAASVEGIGAALLAAAFILLGVGFWRSLRKGTPGAGNKPRADGSPI